MKFYDIMLGVWIFMIISAMVNDLGIFLNKIPEDRASFDTNKAQVFVDNISVNIGGQQANMGNPSSDSGSGVNWLSFLWQGPGMIMTLFSYLINIFIRSINLIGIASQYGIPTIISAPINGIYVFSAAYGLLQWWTARGTKVME